MPQGECRVVESRWTYFWPVSYTHLRGQYVVSSDAGVSLNFVTYNEALHFFADPDYRVGAGVGLSLIHIYVHLHLLPLSSV